MALFLSADSKIIRLINKVIALFNNMIKEISGMN